MSKPNLLLSVKISFLKIPYVNNSNKTDNAFIDNLKKNIVKLLSSLKKNNLRSIKVI